MQSQFKIHAGHARRQTNPPRIQNGAREARPPPRALSPVRHINACRGASTPEPACSLTLLATVPDSTNKNIALHSSRTSAVNQPPILSYPIHLVLLSTTKIQIFANSTSSSCPHVELRDRSNERAMHASSYNWQATVIPDEETRSYRGNRRQEPSSGSQQRRPPMTPHMNQHISKADRQTEIETTPSVRRHRLSFSHCGTAPRALHSDQRTQTSPTRITVGISTRSTLSFKNVLHAYCTLHLQYCANSNKSETQP